MTSAEIITIGTEILLGEIVDTNTRYLAKNLRGLGIDLYRTITIGDNVDRIAEAIRHSMERAEIVITTGGLFLDVDRVPPNCFIEEFAPGRPIMEKSSAVVNHGGNGTVYQAITAGAPIIGIPYHIDQEINLQRVEELGFGVMISEKKCNATTLFSALQKLVRDSSYRENARKLQGCLKQYPGPALAARHIDEFLSS